MFNDAKSLRRKKRIKRANGLLKRLAFSWFTPLLSVPVYLLSACLFLNITNSVSFNIPLLESIFRPFPEDRLVQAGLTLLFVDLVRVFIYRKLKDEDRTIVGIPPLFVFASFMIAIGFLFWSNLPSHEERARYNAEKSCSELARGEENGTVYENGRCYWKKDIKYVDQSLKIIDTKDGIVRRNEITREYVKSIEVTVDTGVFDGKEYKKGDTIFFEQGSSKLNKYRVAEINSTKYLVTINPHTYKWDVENRDTGNKLPPVLEIDGKKYDKTVEADHWESLSENTRYRDTVEAYVKSGQ